MRTFRLFLFCCLVIISTKGSAMITTYAGDTLIKVTGKLINKETQEPIAGKLFYEKLPYYDDMGIGKSQEDGTYQLYMLKNTSYNIKVSAEGYTEVKEEIVVGEDDSTGTMTKHFELEQNADNKMISLDNLIFSRGRAVISQSSYKELDEFVDWLKKNQDVKFRLDGHTDFQGNDEANMKLSQERVDAVRDYLIKKGIKGSRVKTKAFGGTQPLSRERTDEAKKANRRVEVTIL